MTLPMKTTGIADAKSHLSALLADIEAGEEVAITRRGKPVARLVAEPCAEGFGWSDLRTWVAQGAAPQGLTVAEMREQDRL